MRRLPPSATLFPYTTLFRAVSAAHVSDQQASVNDGRRGRAINRRSRFELPGEIFPPEQLAFRRVVTGQNAGDAKRVELAVTIDRSRFRPFAVACGRLVHRVGDGITVLPDCFACVEIVSGDDFILGLSRVQVDAAPDDQRRRMANADWRLPNLFKLTRPGLWRGEACDDAVPVGSAPLRPILREYSLN